MLSMPRQCWLYGEFSVPKTTVIVSDWFFKDGRRDRDRTCNPRLRRPVLYPIELLARRFAAKPLYRPAVSAQGPVADRAVSWNTFVKAARA